MPKSSFIDGMRSSGLFFVRSGNEKDKHIAKTCHIIMEVGELSCRRQDCVEGTV